MSSPFFLKVRTLLVAAAGLTLTQCAGYHLGTDKPGRLLDVNTLAVPVFKNKTLEPRSSVLVTNAVVSALQLDGTYRLVDTSLADATLHGTIRRIERRQLRSSRINTLKTRELEIKLIVEFTIEDRSGAVLMKGEADGSTNVFLDPNFQLSERQAIDDAAQRCAQDIVSRVCEGWGAAEIPDESTPAPASTSSGPPKKAKRKTASLPEILR